MGHSVYQVSCSVCSFERTVAGVYEALDTAEAHESEYSDHRHCHTVHVDLRGEPAVSAAEA